MKFEKAREKFVSALCGRFVDGPDGSKNTDLEVFLPPDPALNVLATNDNPMDSVA